jgi:hypothetical protein
MWSCFILLKKTTGIFQKCPTFSKAAGLKKQTGYTQYYWKSRACFISFIKLKNQHFYIFRPKAKVYMQYTIHECVFCLPSTHVYLITVNLQQRRQPSFCLEHYLAENGRPCPVPFKLPPSFPPLSMVERKSTNIRNKGTRHLMTKTWPICKK